MAPKMKTTITAIVTKEDGAYCVYFGTVLRIGNMPPISDTYWYATDKSPYCTSLEEAKAYADRTAQYTQLDQHDREMMDKRNRISCGNYQGCWNAPVVYRTVQRHDGDLWP